MVDKVSSMVKQPQIPGWNHHGCQDFSGSKPLIHSFLWHLVMFLWQFVMFLVHNHGCQWAFSPSQNVSPDTAPAPSRDRGRGTAWPRPAFGTLSEPKELLEGCRSRTLESGAGAGGCSPARWSPGGSPGGEELGGALGEALGEGPGSPGNQRCLWGFFKLANGSVALTTGDAWGFNRCWFGHCWSNLLMN